MRRPEADPSDPRAEAARLGFDPQRMFAFVRDEIVTEPYRGILRGARGTLAGRAGNTADKSLLLQSLLQAAGRETRLKRGTLRPERARELLEQYRATDPLQGAWGRFLPSSRPEEGGEAFGRRSGLPFETIRDSVASARRERRRLIVDLRARTLATAEIDATALDPAAKPGSKARVGVVETWKELRDAVRLVADGATIAGTVPDGWILLPDSMTGGALVFEAPENASNLEVRLDFGTRSRALVFPIKP